MSARPPTPVIQDHPFAAWSAAWDGALHMQQRWWAQWAEGLQLWTSWWLTPVSPMSSAEWTQAAEQGLRSATEAAQTVAAQAGEVVQAAAHSPVMMMPPGRGRGQARPH